MWFVSSLVDYLVDHVFLARVREMVQRLLLSRQRLQDGRRRTAMFVTQPTYCNTDKGSK
jgi:hypothetical protein